MIKSPRGTYYSVRRVAGTGLSEGMSLQVVAAPVKDGKARLLGEATVMRVTDGRALMSPDERVRNAGKVDRFVVLPKAPIEASQAGTTPPPTEAAPAQTPAEPRKLNGRTSLKSIGPFVQKIVLTSTDTLIWSDCILVIRGRDMYKLGGMAPSGTREIALSDFVKGGRDVPFVGKDRVGLFCAEGQAEFPAKL